MKNIFMLSMLLMITLAGVCQNGAKVQWFKGNLHTHSLWSDGDGYPEMIVDWYKSNGYNFVALSDHNILAQGEKWVKVPKSQLHEGAFDKYLERFGDDWVEQKIDSVGRINVRLKTYDEYSASFGSKDFIMLKSEEITDQYERKPVHINVTNPETLIPPQGGTSVLDIMQRTIDAVLEQRKRTGKPMFAHINHPNFYYAVTVDDMIALKGERFFEVYNGHPLVHNSGDSAHVSTEEMWDRINIAYAQRGQDLMFGVATDDSHHYHLFGKTYSNAGRGWVVVRSSELNVSALIFAMEKGDFYASTGVELELLKVENNRLNIRVKEEKNIAYTIELISADKNGNVNRKIVKGPKASVALQMNDLFLRAKIVSSKKTRNPVNELDYETAWTQPVSYNSK